MSLLVRRLLTLPLIQLMKRHLYNFCVDFSSCFIIKQFVDSLEQSICCNKTSFHPNNSWTSSGLRETEIQHLIYVLGGSMHMLRQGCSLSMFHRTCEILHWGVRLGRLSMPNIICMPLYFKPRGIKKYCNTQCSSLGSLVFTHLGGIRDKDATNVYNHLL